jgi:RES domain-containing protein
MRLFRLHRGHRAADDYQGSLIQPNRWNPAGVPILYCSAALSLACLEVLVHLRPDQIPLDYVFSSAESGGLVATAEFRGDLADEEATRRFGHAWANSRQSLALLVPSAIIPVEFNVLLNPVHPYYANVIWGTPEPFRFDQRLLRRTRAVK